MRLVFVSGGIHIENLVLDGLLLGGEEVKPLLDGDPLPRILQLNQVRSRQYSTYRACTKSKSGFFASILSPYLVFRREPGGVRGECGIALGVGFGESVDAAVGLVEVVHEIHCDDQMRDELFGGDHVVAPHLE